MRNWRNILIIILIIINIVLGAILIKNWNQIINADKELSLSEFDEEYKERLKQELIKEIEEGKQKYTMLYEDLTKGNTSTQLKRDRQIGDNIKMTNIKLEGIGPLTTLTAVLTNESDTETEGDFPVTIRFVDEDGQNIMEIGGYVSKLEPRQFNLFSTSITRDVINAYDFEIIIQ